MLYGLDVGGTKIEIAVFNEKLEKLHAERVSTPKDSYENWLNTIVALVNKMDSQFATKGKVGIGVPGFIHPETTVSQITNIPVASGHTILKDLADRLGREVRGENDANCFALSEAWDEENQHFSSVLGLILGTGFGGGIIFDGKVHSGQSGMAGELGHLQLNYHALKLLGWDNAPIYPCGCGNEACLDTYLSGRGFELLYRDLVGEALNAKEIIAKFYDKEEKTVQFVDTFMKLCAISIGNIITAFDPELIVLGGGLSNFDHLYQALPELLPNYLMKGAKLPMIKKAKYGDAGGARGAAALWLKDIAEKTVVKPNKA